MIFLTCFIITKKYRSFSHPARNGDNDRALSTHFLPHLLIELPQLLSYLLPTTVYPVTLYSSSYLYTVLVMAVFLCPHSKSTSLTKDSTHFEYNIKTNKIKKLTPKQQLNFAHSRHHMHFLI